MSYHGYIPFVKRYFATQLQYCNNPSFLEVGVDRGVTFLSIVTFLARTRQHFFALGVDVLVQEQVSIMLNNLDLTKTQCAHLVQENSLNCLPKLIEQNVKFNVIFLDGDHNYHTVSNELNYVDSLLAPNGLLIIDDYNGRWSERDLYYSEREEYKNVTGTTSRVTTTHQGVKPAVDQWLLNNPNWKLSQPIVGEPVLLERV